MVCFAFGYIAKCCVLLVVWFVVNFVDALIVTTSIKESHHPSIPSFLSRGSDICGVYSNGRRAYLEPGDGGYLIGRNITTVNGVVSLITSIPTKCNGRNILNVHLENFSCFE